MQERLKQKAVELLENGTVNRVLGWKTGEFFYDLTPAVFTTKEEIENEFVGCGYGKFKPVVGEAVVEHLRPIREESLRLMKDKAYLESVYRDGAQKASYVAEKTLRKVYKKVGFVAR